MFAQFPRTIGIVVAMTMGMVASACLRGPSLGAVKTRSSRGASGPAIIIVPTSERDGVVSGSLSAGATVAQVLKTSPDGPLAGASVTFQPGTLSVDTTIRVQTEATVADKATAAKLGISSDVVSAGVPMGVRPESPTDPLRPFTIALPLPTGTGLALAGSYPNLVVVYKLRKFGSDKTVTGVWLRDDLTVANGFVTFATPYFGIFQTLITARTVSEARELERDGPLGGGAKLRFVKGMAFTAPEGDGNSDDPSFRAWGLPVAPAKAGSERSVTAGYVTKHRSED